MSSLNSNSTVFNDDDDDDNDDSRSSSSSQPSQYDGSFGGGRFHVGIVFGWFFILGAIDLYFGAPLVVFATLFASLLACLSLCYMAWWSSMIDS